MLSLIMHATGEDMSNITEPTNILSQVNYVTKMMAAYTRRAQHGGVKGGPLQPLSLVLRERSSSSRSIRHASTSPTSTTQGSRSTRSRERAVASGGGSREADSAPARQEPWRLSTSS